MNSGFPGCSNARAEDLLRGRVMAAYREIAPYEVANSRAKVMLEELCAERLNKTPNVQPVNKPAEPLIAGLGRAARRFLAFCETLGRAVKEALK